LNQKLNKFQSIQSDIHNILTYNILLSRKSTPIKKFIELQLKEKQSLNAINEGERVYCFPSLGDHFHKMIPLAEKISFPILGLNWTENFNSFSSMDEITNQWLDVILKDSIYESDDGFNLIGYSFGGIAAFETAIKLQKQRKKIKNLILIDSSPLNEILEQTYYNYGKLFELSDKFSEPMKMILDFLSTHIIVDYNAIKKQLIALQNKEEIIKVIFN
jgi:hypothetical protein